MENKEHDGKASIPMLCEEEEYNSIHQAFDLLHKELLKVSRKYGFNVVLSSCTKQVKPEEYDRSLDYERRSMLGPYRDYLTGKIVLEFDLSFVDNSLKFSGRMSKKEGTPYTI